MLDDELKKLWMDNHYNKNIYEITLHLHTLTFSLPRKIWTLSCKWECFSTLNFIKLSEVAIFIKHFD